MRLLFVTALAAVLFAEASLASVSVPVDLRTVLRKVDGDDDNYYTQSWLTVDLGVGTPPQQFRAGISLDTATSWVPDRTCIYHPKECPNYCSSKGALCKFICRSDCCGPNAWPPSEPTCRKKENLIDCGSGKKFNNETSTTYKLDGSWFCNEAFAIQAFTGIDTVQIGSPKGADLSIPSSMFGQVWQQDIDVELPIDAVFGKLSEWAR
ncbi:Protein ASP-2 b [Aphelenchoides avenae]|nr:Protein ASP-2 b [Aphelenchus avenae]